ncbi:MAG: hypothetical protein NC115_11460, partial [Bacteroidales bacterium]|nr:hypothetical protein [Bacteroidales bacterium]
MKPPFIILLFGLVLISCHRYKPVEEACKYDKAEVYYVKDPRWLKFGYNTTFKNFVRTRTRDMLYYSFPLSDRDSLNYISGHISRADKVQSQMLRYWLPRIVVLLHSSEGVDTLVTSTHPDQPLQFNSWSIQDGTLSLLLTECVGKHDRYWATLTEYHFY